MRNLSVTFPSEEGPVHAVNGFNLHIGPRERVGIVGESGSGKSVTALSILRLLGNARVTGEILFDGADLLDASPKAMQRIRGGEIGYIFQDPMSALNPVLTVGAQVREALRLHGVGRKEAAERAIDILQRVGIPDAQRRARGYPHQYSGGMRQRVMIAMALVCGPKLLIADEPTTALDVLVQQQVLELILDLADEQDLAILFISHDLNLLAGFVERAVAMYAGRPVEKCSIDDLFERPRHPYTLGLMESIPNLVGPPKDQLRVIPGYPPTPTTLPTGCPFHPRCSFVRDVCREIEPPLESGHDPTHESACHFSDEVAETRRAL
ncbi:MAG: ABC transporter ATP-binding protein [Dehalococcoidia bacterium]